MVTKRSHQKKATQAPAVKDQPHSGGEGEAPSALPTEGATQAPAIEKRESPRVDVCLPVTLRHNGKLIPATTENVSCGGMYLSSPTGEITLGGNVEVILDLTEMERDVTLRGSVVRVGSQDNKKMAIQFVNLLSGGHTTFQRFLRKMQK